MLKLLIAGLMMAGAAAEDAPLLKESAKVEILTDARDLQSAQIKALDLDRQLQAQLQVVSRASEKRKATLRKYELKGWKLNADTLKYEPEKPDK